MAAEEAAQWMIDRVIEESVAYGQPMKDAPRDMLSRSVASLGPDEIPAMMALNNMVVTLARSAMVRAKNGGAPTTKARRGLVVPTDWFNNYNLAYNANNDWVISAIMQNAMLANPLAGERRPWKSK